MARVREGESILIVDRQQPVARLEPVTGVAAHGLPWQNDLVRRGLVRPARGRFEARAFAALALPEAKDGGDLLKALLAEREEGR